MYPELVVVVVGSDRMLAYSKLPSPHLNTLPLH